MKKLLSYVLVAVIAASTPALADLAILDGNGAAKTLFNFVCFTTKICQAQVLVNSAGTEIATSSNPVRTDPTGSTTQPVSAASLPLPSGAATSANQTTANSSLATIATNSGSSIPAGTNRIGYASDDPCAQLTKLGAPINLTASGQLIAGTAAKKTYICAIDIVPAAAQNIALVEGTGSTCATNIYGLAGGTTAATGWNFAAGGGIARGGGAGTIYSPSADTNATAANVCLLLSGGAVQVSGQVTYVQQ